MSKLDYVYGDDWCGIYVDGLLVAEGHSLSTMEVVGICMLHRIDNATSSPVDIEWLHDRGDLPRQIEDVKWAA